jgi:hypothetical protein
MQRGFNWVAEGKIAAANMDKTHYLFKKYTGMGPFFDEV